MNERFAVLGLLLDYPTAETHAALDELVATAADPHVDAFAEACRGRALLELQGDYVATFDMRRDVALHLSWYAYGDRRQRGLAMLELKRRYAEPGWVLDSGELPDHLPVMLEFAALAGASGLVVLEDFRPALELLRARLHEAQSPYALLLDAVCARLAPLGEAEIAEARRMAFEGPPTEEVGLEPFGPPEAMPACPEVISA